MMIFYSFFFFKQKTAYEMRISDWSSDVCSSDLLLQPLFEIRAAERNRLHHEKQTLTRAGRLGQAALFDDFGEPFQLAAEWHLVAHLVEQHRQHPVARALPDAKDQALFVPKHEIDRHSRIAGRFGTVDDRGPPLNP